MPTATTTSATARRTEGKPVYRGNIEVSALRKTVIAALSLVAPGCTTGGADSAALTTIGRCLAHQAPAYTEAANRSLAQLSSELLTTRQFAVFSHIYPSQPANGYPIRFLADGSVAGTQYDGYRWSVTRNGLLLTDVERVSAQLFRFDRECVSMTHRPEDLANPMLQMEMAIVETR